MALREGTVSATLRVMYLEKSSSGYRPSLSAATSDSLRLLELGEDASRSTSVSVASLTCIRCSRFTKHTASTAHRNGAQVFW